MGSIYPVKGKVLACVISKAFSQIGLGKRVTMSCGEPSDESKNYVMSLEEVSKQRMSQCTDVWRKGLGEPK